MKSLGIRLQLTVFFGGALALLLLTFAAFGYFYTRYNLLQALDRQLHFDQEILEDHIEVQLGGEVVFKPFGYHLARFFEVEGFWWEVWSEDRQLLFRKWPFEESEVKQQLPLLPTPERVYISAELPGSLRMRAMQKVKRYGERELTLRVVRSEGELQRTLADLRLINLIALPIGLLAAAAGGYVLAGRALRPVRLITEQARRITASSLADRVAVPNTRDELGQLAAVFNETLARLEKSFDEMKRFTADASHELRTPLTAIRTTGQMALRPEATPDELRNALGSILEEEARLAALVDALLTLARADANRHELNLQPCLLGTLALEVCGYLEVLAETKAQRLHVEASEDLAVDGDPVLLRHALFNLVDNAIKYGGGESRIDVIVRRAAPAWVEVEIANQGAGIAADQREQIFDRFYRGDRSRSATNPRGFGLGLAIVRWITESHGGSVRVGDNSPDQRTRFILRLPAPIAR